MLRHLLYCGMVLLSLSSAFGQIHIHGTISDAATGAPVEYVQVVLYRYKTSEIVAFLTSDEQGRYELIVKDKNQAFTLKTQSLTHENVEKDLFLDAREPQRFEVNLSLRSKTHTLNEVQVTAKLPPMIVKQDTIIYNIDHWTDESDQSLEAVLAKIPGFEVLSDGELKVNGKVVNKVLVDGEEVTDGGAALLTKTLTPGRVKSVEVRFDEKNDKLKESLLSKNNFVVLDIKLKDDFDHSLFGRVSATLGYQHQVRPGGFTSLFSLKDKAKFQLLGEWDDFGDKTISLASIKNLGAEAYAKIFEIPADFTRIQENPEYSNEIYGFREYIAHRSGAAGITGKTTVSPSVELFVGSYNYLNRTTSQRNVAQTLLADTLATFFFNQQQGFLTRHSKNKIELVVNQKNTKLTYNFNAVFSNNEADQFQNQSIGTRYNFLNVNETQEYYHNLFFERRFAEQSGIQFNALYTTNDQESNRTLEHNDPVYALFFDSLSSHSAYLLNQRIPLQQERLLVNGMYQTTWKGQMIQTGVRYLQDALAGEKQFTQGEEPPTTTAINVWQGNFNRLRYQQVLPFLEHQFDIGAFSISNKVGWTFNDFPSASIRQNKNILEWSTRLNYSFSNQDAINFSYNQSTASFPLYQLLPGQELIDFQTIAIPNRYRLLPRRERVMNFSANTFALSEYGIALEVAGISGKAFNNASFGFNEYGFIEQYYDQLPSEYVVLVSKVGKVFERIPLQMKLESNWVYNKNYNRTATDEETFVSTNIQSIDYRAFTTFKEKTFDFETRVKFTNFVFSSEGNINSRSQQMWNVFFKYNQSFLQRKLLFTAHWRYASFNGAGAAELWLMDAALSYVHKKTSFSLLLHNLFNERQFIIQNITPAFYVDSRQFIFPRYAKVGISVNVN